MSRIYLSSLLIAIMTSCCTTIPDDATINMIGHGSLRIETDGKVIQIDPYSDAGNYDNQPKADLVLLTHEHSDHLDSVALSKVMKPSTEIIGTQAVAQSVPNIKIMNNGDKLTWNNVSIESMPAYNIVNLRPDGQPFHPKGRGNGYMLTIGKKRIYIAGDTELIPEMKNFGAIDIAIVPKNLPYTMSDEMFVEAVKVLSPKELYPYHYFEIDRKALESALPNMIIH